MKSYIDDIVVVDPIGEEAILYPHTKQEAVEGLLERFSNLEMPDITETTSTTQPNSHAGREMVLEIGGAESEQETTAGNQLWNGKYVTNALNNEQDNFVADTTMAGNIRMPVTAGKQYSLSINGELTTMRYSFKDADGNSLTALANAKTTVIAPEGTASMTWRVNSYHAETDEVMLNEGTEALPYEQYTGGQPAPNPSYSMPIKNSKVKGIRTYGGENFYDGTLYGGYYSNANFDLSLANVAVYKSIKVYLTKGIHTILFSKKVNVVRLVADGVITETTAVNVMSYTFTANSNGYVGISFRDATSSTTVWDETTSIGVYNTSEYTFSQPIDLYGKDGLQDVITAQPIKRRFAKRIFDGSESWSTSATLTGRFIVAGLGCKSSGKVLCTQAKSGLAFNTTTINECYLSGNSNGQLVINTEFATLDEWKAHLTEKPMEVVYELAEEATEELPIADQIGLNSLATYDGITYVEFIYEGLEPTFRGKYGTSEVGGMTLESLLTARNNELKQELANERLSALEASVVNNI